MGWIYLEPTPHQPGDFETISRCLYAKLKLVFSSKPVKHINICTLVLLAIIPNLHVEVNTKVFKYLSWAALCLQVKEQINLAWLRSRIFIVFCQYYQNIATDINGFKPWRKPVSPQQGFQSHML